MITRLLHHTDNGHNKFWEATYPDYGDTSVHWWQARWGKIGTQGQTKQFFVGGHITAKHAAEDKIEEKRFKGYYEIIVDEPKQQPPISPKKKPLLMMPTPEVHNIEPVCKEETTKAVLALLDAGFDNSTVSKRLRVALGTVRAIAAHRTMGRYDSPKLTAAANRAKSTGTPIKQKLRKFDLS